MSCDQCREREAVIHLTQIVNEQVTTLHLCERCAAEKGVESPGGVAKTPLGTFLAAMGKGYPEQAAVSARTGDNCPRCGGSLQDFRESGRLGCPECYHSFEAPLRDLLRRLHGSTHHMGERYADRESEPVAPNGARTADLREQLRLAVETENFELAAELRDRLRVLE
ncbi:MAG: UvrB/UvrC motif-containing protein [Gemmatimonadales bacterium]